MDTSNFGQAALEAEAKKASRVTGASKKSSAKQSNMDLPQQPSVQDVEEDME